MLARPNGATTITHSCISPCRQPQMTRLKLFTCQAPYGTVAHAVSAGLISFISTVVLVIRTIIRVLSQYTYSRYQYSSVPHSHDQYRDAAMSEEPGRPGDPHKT